MRVAKSLAALEPEEYEDYSHLGQILDRNALAKLPRPEPLIDGWLDLRTCVVAAGETGTNKTFGALGWAASIATGVPWLGAAVCLKRPVPVLMVVGEGAFGLNDRLAAWEEHHDAVIPPERFQVLVQPDSIATPGVWEQLTSYALAKRVRFVVLDTFSSLAPEADETNDAAMVVRRMSELSRTINGTVVLVHHAGWAEKTRVRGGSQLEADPDGVVMFSKRDKDNPNSTVEIWRKKNKDGPAGHKVWVDRVDVAESCVLVEVGQPPQGASTGAKADAVDAAIIDYVAAHPGCSQRGMKAELGKEKVARGPMLQDRWAALRDAGMIVEKERNKHYLAETISARTVS